MPTAPAIDAAPEVERRPYRPRGFLASDAFRRLYPFTSRYLTVNGHRLHYLDEGSGDPIVLLHGNPTWSFYYRELIKTLRSNFRVVVPDHIGCGLSEKPSLRRYEYRLEDRVRDLEATLEALRIDRNVTLVLHDWGGMIGLAYAIRHRHDIRRLVVTNTSGFHPPIGKAIPGRLRLIRNLQWFGIPAVLGLNLFARGALFMAPRKRLSPQVKAGLIAPYSRPAYRLATLRFVQDIPLHPGDPGFDQVQEVDRQLDRMSALPTLICWGRHDFVFDDDY
ncbi:MAG: alpha/beta fold hydrolase, partial [Desulfobacterales bacterium]